MSILFAYFIKSVPFKTGMVEAILQNRKTQMRFPINYDYLGLAEIASILYIIYSSIINKPFSALTK